MSGWVSACLSVRLPGCLHVDRPADLHICPPPYTFIYLLVHLSTSLYVSLPAGTSALPVSRHACLFMCLRVCLYICLSVYLLICLRACTSGCLSLRLHYFVLPSSRHVCLYVCPALLNLCLSACIIVRLPVCLFVCPPASRQPNDDTECKVPYYHPARCLSPNVQGNLTDHTGSNIKFYL
jgi:hypothetical protein